MIKNCTHKAVFQALYLSRMTNVCTKHLHMIDQARPTVPKIGRLSVDIERDEETYRRQDLGALGGLIYDREKSFSEKVRELDFLF